VVREGKDLKKEEGRKGSGWAKTSSDDYGFIHGREGGIYKSKVEKERQLAQLHHVPLRDQPIPRTTLHLNRQKENAAE